MSNPSATSRQWSLIRRPTGWPVPEDFAYEEAALPDLRDGDVRVENSFVSVDPYMRGRMNDVRSYVPPFELGKPMLGGAVGRVVESNSPDLTVGDLVEHMFGWRDVAQGPARAFARRDAVAGLAESVYLGPLGVPAFTAWVGLTKVARLKAGETVFVSGAAGAVGTAVGQLARLHGASRVIGSAGTPEKIALLTERYGYDEALNYREGSFSRRLAAAAPDGIDVFFDNVGGEQLEAAIFAMNDFGRAALCGAISSYNETSLPAGPRNIWMAVPRRLSLLGFIVIDHEDSRQEFLDEVAPLVASGDFQFDETIVEGVENSLDAFLGLLHGANVGKMLVRTSR